MRTVAQTAILMALLTFISKCTGFLREVIIANFFGATYITDAYVISVAIPMIIFSGVWDAVVTTYMPLYSKIKENEGNRQGDKFTSEAINILILLSIFSSVIGFIFSDQLISIFASGFTGDTAKLASMYLKITFSYMLFQSTSGIFNSYLQYKGIFLTQIIVGYFQNIAIIIFVIISAYTNEYLLAVGGLAAWAIRCIVLALILKQKEFAYTLNFKVHDTIKKMITLSVPVFIGSSIIQINVFIDKALASRLPEGSVASLNYAMTLIGVITGLTIGIFSSIIYPKITQAISTDETDRFRDFISIGVILIFIVCVPFTFGAMLYSEQIVQIIYERGAFDPIATSLTESAFFYYSIGMLFSSITGLFVQAFYALHDMKLPMISSAICVIINILFNLILINSMRHNGLALATSISAICSTIFMYALFKHKYTEIKITIPKRKVLKIIASAIIAVVASYIFYFTIGKLFWMPRMIHFSLAVAFSGVIYLPLLYVLKIEEIKMIKQIIR